MNNLCKLTCQSLAGSYNLEQNYNPEQRNWQIVEMYVMCNI